MVKKLLLWSNVNIVQTFRPSDLVHVPFLVQGLNWLAPGSKLLALALNMMALGLNSLVQNVFALALGLNMLALGLSA